MAPGAAPRPNQAEPLAALLDGARVLCVQATGWGKSTVYFAAALALRHAGLGPTLVVSPLLALMRDQVDAATRAGLSAATINSANLDEWEGVFSALMADNVDILFVSPERLAAVSFADRVPTLLDRVALVVVDEAHCISDWGHDFRPDYRRIATVLARSDARVLATTATANARVCADVSAQLGAGAVTFRGSLARPSLRLHVVAGLDALERYAWVDEALGSLGGTGIVYTLTVAEADRLAGFLASQGHNVRAYSSALGADERLAAEDDLKAGRLTALVATSALGMGYDHPSLAFVIHVGSPASPVAYYQQVGRAGRAIDDATVVLLPAESDTALWDYFATASVPDPDNAAAVLAALDAGPASVVALEATTGIRRGRLEALLKVMAVDGAVVRGTDGWTSTTTGWVFDADHYAALVAQRHSEADVMRSYAAGTGCLMEFLQVALDDPTAGPCGHCSVCTGTLPAPGAQPAAASVAAARAWLRGRDVTLDPRKRWPAGVGRTGRIVGPSAGRALAFADDPAWAGPLAGLRQPDAPAAGELVAGEQVAGEQVASESFAGEAMPSELVDGVIAMLGRWSRVWGERPVCVVPMPSRSHPGRIRALADAIGAAGKLPVVDALSASGPPPPTNATSQARVAALLQGLAHNGTPLPAGPVLLVDDTYRTGWTMTVGAAILRDAGVSAVYPLALHQLP